jgi:hypothetical protein
MALFLALTFQFLVIMGLGYTVWRNLARDEFTHNWRPHWRVEPRFSGWWWFGVIHNVAAMVAMTGVFTYCLITFGINGD